MVVYQEDTSIETKLERVQKAVEGLQPFWEREDMRYSHILLVIVSNGDKLEKHIRKERIFNALLVYFRTLLDLNDAQQILEYEKWKEDGEIIRVVDLPGFTVANFLPERAREDGIDCCQYIVKPEDETEYFTYSICVGPATGEQLEQFLPQYYAKSKLFSRRENND